MILNDREIRALIKLGEFVLDPFEDALVQPSSIDLRLNGFARVLKAGSDEIDIRAENLADFYEDVRLTDDGYTIPPRGTLIGQTMEHMTIPPSCQGMLAQRSSLVRLGIHISSSLINPGYSGNLPLLISNTTDRPIRIFSGVPFCQLVLLRLIGRPDVIYPEKVGAKYHDERKFLTSGIAEDVRRWLAPSARLVRPEQAEAFKMAVSTSEGAGDDEVR
jgi:dCTP deaminase